jgi:RNA polymerase sigma factor for flagellar operon FliA
MLFFVGEVCKESNMSLQQKTEEELWREYKQTKDPAIREELIIRYAPVVKYIAGRIAIGMPPQVEFEDLISYGILGLIDAIEKYDATQGTKFKTYASARIRGAIIDEIRHLDWAPRSLRQKAKILEDTYATLEHKLGRPATDEEVAEDMGISTEDLSKLIQEVSSTILVSLDDVWCIKDEDEVIIMDTVESPPEKSPEVVAEREEVKNILINAINRLPERERLVIALYYYDGLTLKEIGTVLNVTESRVSQLHAKAMFRLRGYLNRMRKDLL